MPIYSVLPDDSDIDQRLQNLKNSGMLVGSDESIINKKLNDLANEVKQGQIGAKGEVTFLERQIFGEGRQVLIIPDPIQSNVKIPDYAVYQDRGGTLGREITEVKTTVRTTNVTVGQGWEKWIKSKINEGNKQLKRSGITYGIPGSLEMQLYESAKSEFAQILQDDATTVESWVTREFRPNQMRSLRRVAIYGNGKLLLEFTRTVENQIVKTFPA
ncbi:MAG: hypothetical protein GDA56_30205 [Hormoscilla sp. GM7CHS1pb]|nr:hypothetical protein [Hormoscilla sp. GM7CHS1pb]